VTSENVPVTIDDDSYVPQIRITVDNQELPPSVLADVIDLKVTLQSGQPGGCTMTLSNHFTILETEQHDSLRKYQHSDGDVFDVFKQITVEMGYVGRMQLLFVGEIQSLQPSFPSAGAPTLTVTGIDYLNRLRNDKPGNGRSKAYRGRADWQIVQDVVKRHPDLAFSEESDKNGPINVEPVMQGDKDDLEFVLRLAQRNDFECRFIIDKSDNRPALYFGLPLDKRDGRPITQLQLAWEQSLISFTPKQKTGHLVSKVTVRGWNPRKKEPFEYATRLDDIAKTGGEGETGPELLKDKIAGKDKTAEKEERIVDRAIQSQEEAKRLAIKVLNENAYKFLTGSGEAMGEPKIRPQVNLKLTGLGRYDLVYYVTKVDHTYGASGYTTSFEVEALRRRKSS
jgi:phage protein D